MGRQSPITKHPASLPYPQDSEERGNASQLRRHVNHLRRDRHPTPPGSTYAGGSQSHLQHSAESHANQTPTQDAPVYDTETTDLEQPFTPSHAQPSNVASPPIQHVGHWPHVVEQALGEGTAEPPPAQGVNLGGSSGVERTSVPYAIPSPAITGPLNTRLPTHSYAPHSDLHSIGPQMPGGFDTVGGQMTRDKHLDDEAINHDIDMNQLDETNLPEGWHALPLAANPQTLIPSFNAALASTQLEGAIVHHHQVESSLLVTRGEAREIEHEFFPHPRTYSRDFEPPGPVYAARDASGENPAQGPTANGHDGTFHHTPLLASTQAQPVQGSPYAQQPSIGVTDQIEPPWGNDPSRQGQARGGTQPASPSPGFPQVQSAPMGVVNQTEHRWGDHLHQEEVQTRNQRADGSTKMQTDDARDDSDSEQPCGSPTHSPSVAGYDHQQAVTSSEGYVLTEPQPPTNAPNTWTTNDVQPQPHTHAPTTSHISLDSYRHQYREQTQVVTGFQLGGFQSATPSLAFALGELPSSTNQRTRSSFMHNQDQTSTISASGGNRMQLTAGPSATTSIWPQPNVFNQSSPRDTASSSLQPSPPGPAQGPPRVEPLSLLPQRHAPSDSHPHSSPRRFDDTPSTALATIQAPSNDLPSDSASIRESHPAVPSTRQSTLGPPYPSFHSGTPYDAQPPTFALTHTQPTTYGAPHPLTSTQSHPRASYSTATQTPLQAPAFSSRQAPPPPSEQGAASGPSETFYNRPPHLPSLSQTQLQIPAASTVRHPSPSQFNPSGSAQRQTYPVTSTCRPPTTRATQTQHNQPALTTTQALSSGGVSYASPPTFPQSSQAPLHTPAFPRALEPRLHDRQVQPLPRPPPPPQSSHLATGQGLRQAPPAPPYRTVPAFPQAQTCPPTSSTSPPATFGFTQSQPSYPAPSTAHHDNPGLAAGYSQAQASCAGPSPGLRYPTLSTAHIPGPAQGYSQTQVPHSGPLPALHSMETRQLSARAAGKQRASNQYRDDTYMADDSDHGYSPSDSDGDSDEEDLTKLNHRMKQMKKFQADLLQKHEAQQQQLRMFAQAQHGAIWQTLVDQTNPEPTSTPKRLKKTVVRNHISPEKLQVQHLVRDMWEQKMAHYSEPELYATRSYQSHDPMPNHGDLFKPEHRLGMAKCPWNAHWVEVVFQAIMQSNDPRLPVQPGRSHCKLITTCIWKRLESWRRSRRNPLTFQQQAEKRRSERRRVLFLNRRNVALAWEDTNHHVDMLEAYGPAGMSTDESEHESAGNGVSRYHIVEKHWRHPDATACFRALDGNHRGSRFRIDAQGQTVAGPGAPGRNRTVDTTSDRPRVSSSRPKTELAVGLYNPLWVADAVWKRILDPIPGPSYDFSLPPDFYKVAARNDGDASRLDQFPGYPPQSR